MATNITLREHCAGPSGCFPRGQREGVGGPGLLLLASHCMPCDPGSSLPLSGLLCYSPGKGQNRSRKSFELGRQPRIFLYGDP